MINIEKTSGIVTVTTDAGLPKSYFNSSCSYTALSENNMVYFKINGDSYEIPLSSLQINGISPTSLSDSIAYISNLLTN
jgi:hypothetical protein